MHTCGKFRTHYHYPTHNKKARKNGTYHTAPVSYYSIYKFIFLYLRYTIAYLKACALWKVSLIVSVYLSSTEKFSYKKIFKTWCVK